MDDSGAVNMPPTMDSFPISRLDLPLPFDTRLQAKPAYWGIVDPTKLKEPPPP